ncbi:uncharacterized protein PHALS_14568 [Plasmopara halstedii]|uniref:Uncharacterized protein n=1 Tax=Plasmopara halstedii TaxID=4781 RepID=A0A0P1AKY3_PLAHL|nr:uncharacterized protein PHALS_14568 [Plasmopara halstedii]CEG41810.1 hypothetical protein PHALS_14568 [Plasmopara halstedii]|eukprot:XP_024578179.1 hypothetical protein PHALS_14568 [Plasmopara halstedii]
MDRLSWPLERISIKAEISDAVSRSKNVSLVRKFATDVNGTLRDQPRPDASRRLCVFGSLSKISDCQSFKLL